MTQNLEVSPPAAGGSDRRPTRQDPPPPAGQAWWRRPVPWLGLLAASVIFNGIYALPRHLSLDPGQALIMMRPDVEIHYSLLVLHVVTGNIAMIALFFQLWKWLRDNHPKVHRISGRFYVWAGALPSAVFGLALVFLRPGLQGSMGLTLAGVGWIVATLIGWNLARQGRYAEHRRWMIYSFALALATTYGRVLFVLMSTFGFSIDLTLLVEFANWGSWVINLVLAQWWLDRGRYRKRRRVETTV